MGHTATFQETTAIASQAENARKEYWPSPLGLENYSQQLIIYKYCAKDIYAFVVITTPTSTYMHNMTI